AALPPGGGEVRSSFTRFLAEGEQRALWDALGAGEGDLVLVVADALDVARVSLGRLRQELARRLNLLSTDVLAWAFVTEFPWFEPDADGRLTFMHHPFTMPFDEDLPLLDTDPLRVRAKAYDVVA